MIGQSDHPPHLSSITVVLKQNGDQLDSPGTYSGSVLDQTIAFAEGIPSVSELSIHLRAVAPFKIERSSDVPHSVDDALTRTRYISAIAGSSNCPFYSRAFARYDPTDLLVRDHLPCETYY